MIPAENSPAARRQAGNSFIPLIAQAIAKAETAPDKNQIARALGVDRDKSHWIMHRMVASNLIATVAVKGRRGISHAWTLTEGGRALLNGYIPSPGDAGDTRRLDCTALMDALGMPRSAPPLPLTGRITTVCHK